MRCVPCGSDRSPATKIRSGFTSSSSRADDRDVGRADRILAHLAGLIERQIEEARRAARQANGLDAAHRLGFANDALDVLDLRECRLRPGASGRATRCAFVGELRRPGRASMQSFGREPLEEVDVAAHVVIEHGDVAARHVRDDDVVVVLRQLAENAAHRDHVVVRMRREADDRAARRQLGLAANLGAERVEHLAVHFARRSELGDERRHARVGVVALRELEDRLARAAATARSPRAR